ncbi:MAG: alanine racemase [Gemmatimonas sp.]
MDVDLDAVRRNALKLRARAGVPLIAMVKADGYGTGMLPVVRALGGSFRGGDPSSVSMAAPWAFGVATLDEAATLRQAGCLSRILCTTPLTLRDLPDARSLDARPALHRAEDITAWSALRGGAWHLSIDTGMSRAGVRWDEVGALAPVLREHPPEGIFTHFHSAELADGSREEQERRFAHALRKLGDAVPPNALIHSDNSAAIAARGPSPGHLARPGIGLYGSTAVTALDLEQVVHLRARVVDIRHVHNGESVSYGATYTAAGTRHIATVALGYADGYRRALSNHAEALLRGRRVTVVGTITMDMTMLDVTALDGACAVGDPVTFIGRDGGDCLWTDDVARSGDLSPYELLVGLRLRVPRRYFEASADGSFDADHS